MRRPQRPCQSCDAALYESSRDFRVSETIKAATVNFALALEQKTAPLRTDDDLICRDGLDQIRAGLERGSQQEVPSSAGHIGKTIAVTPPPDYVPKFRSPDAYRPEQDKSRAGIRENLMKLAGQPS
jgi:hypothetical protein